MNKRLNIIDLKNNHPERFGVFVMALRNLIDSHDWPRICGIHGNTFKPNDKGVLCPTDPEIVTILGETGEPFYCKHSVYSFIAWHTPYIYQFELLLNKYNKSTNESYITLPYIDLTDFSVDFTFMNDPEITIFYNKRQITIENPLAGAYYYVNGVKTKTTRTGFLSPRTPNERMQLRTIKKQLNNTLYATNYERFSSVPVTHKPSNIVVDYVPLETPHNQLHDIIGGDTGNMSDVSVAAFDPIFWLHHSNMDRHFYTWLHNNTNNFKDSIYPDKILKVNYEATFAPFFKKYVYNTDWEIYKYGWQNSHLEFLKLKDTLQFNKYPYRYDIIQPTPEVPLTAFIELIDIPIPRQSVSIFAYLCPKNTLLNRSIHFAGATSWFGINRNVKYCKRCEVTRTNLKIDIQEYVEKNKITNDNIGDYTLTFETNIDKMKGDLLIQDGSYQIILI